MRNLIIGALLLSAAAAPALAQSVAPATGPRFMSVSDASALSSNLVGLSVTNAGGQTRIYQRLIADDADEAIEIASAEIEESSIIAFYDTVGIDILRLASQEHLTNARPEHRLRLADGMSTLLEDLRDQYPPSVPDRKESPAVLCIGGKWEVDALAGEMLAHALAVEGIAASSRPAASGNAAYLAKLDLNGAEVVCLSFLTPNPALPARNACRRIRRQWPNLRIVLALWNAPPDLLTDEALEQFKADAIVTSVQEAVRRIHRIVDPDGAMTNQAASLPDDDQKRVHALAATRILDGDKRYMLDALAKRAADVFDARLSVISAIDKDHEYFIGQSGKFPNAITDDAGALVPIQREQAICNYVVGDNEALVIPDIERDPRFADNETIKLWDVRFYAGAPVRIDDGTVIGALCLLDPAPRAFTESEVALLETIAADVAAVVSPNSASERPKKPAPNVSSSTVGQRVPDAP